MKRSEMAAVMAQMFARCGECLEEEGEARLWNHTQLWLCQVRAWIYDQRPELLPSAQAGIQNAILLLAELRLLYGDRMHPLKTFGECNVLRDAGQKEYAHDDGNAFANFERTGADIGVSREKVLWIFLKKHLDGIQAWLDGHKSQREPVEGRIKDSIVYLCLLAGMAREAEPGFDPEEEAQRRIMEKRGFPPLPRP